MIKRRETEVKGRMKDREAKRGRAEILKKEKEAGEKVLGFISSSPDSVMPDDLGHVTLPSVPPVWPVNIPLTLVKVAILCLIYGLYFILGLH